MQKRKLGPTVREEKKQSIKTKPEMAQMTNSADKDYNVACMCYREKRKLFKELKKKYYFNEWTESLGRKMEAK